MTIHASDPFATPEGSRSPARRLRGRLPAAVTLWTAVGGNGRPAGLTVSSTVVIDGDPARLLGVVDEESELWAAAEASGKFAVTALTERDRHLADVFAGLMPAPGGGFAGRTWTETGFGPVIGGATWAGCRLEASRSLGWGLLVEATIEHVQIADDPAGPLVHFRGRYHGLG